MGRPPKYNNCMDFDAMCDKIETLSEAVHDSWWDEKKKQGFHAPEDCRCIEACKAHQHDIKSLGLHPFMKFHKYCDHCHTDMYPYSDLPENVKDYDRVTVRTVLDAIKKLEE